MKQGIALLWLAALLLALAACGGSPPAPAATPTPLNTAPAADLPTDAPPTATPLPTALPPTPEPATAVPVDTAVPAGDAAATPAEAPPPTPDPAADPQGYLATLAHTPDPALVDRTWAWQGREQGGTAVFAVPDPEQYTLTFRADGTLDARLACNTGSGSYATTTDDAGAPAIFIVRGPQTQAACRPGALDADMQALFDARAYAISPAGDTLRLLSADGSTADVLGLVPAANLPAPGPANAAGRVTSAGGTFLRSGPGPQFPVLAHAAQGVEAAVVGSAPLGGWWQLTAPGLPGGVAWAPAEDLDVPDASLLPVINAPRPEGLAGTPWQWTSTTAAEEVLVVPAPEQYVIRFDADGRALILADCSLTLGSYTVAETAVSITLGPGTPAQCGAGSLDADFLYGLARAASYSLQDGSLFLALPEEEGTMRLLPQGAPLPAEAASLEAIVGVPLTLTAFGPADAPQTPLAGSQITAVFDSNLVNGQAGCNTYSGALLPGDGFFTIGPLVSTQEVCAEPAGVMEQEQAFLAALQRTDGLQWERVRDDASGTFVTNVQTTYTLLNGEQGVLTFTSAP